MPIYYRNAPRSKCPFLKEENMMDTFITPFSSTPRGGSRCGCSSTPKFRGHRNVERFNQPMSSYFYTKEQKPWFTVIPLGEEMPVERENIRVKLNPLNRQLIIKVLTNMAPSRRRTLLSGNKMTQPIVFVVPLPREIRLEELQVKLTQHNELVILAPFKPTSTGMRLPLDEETLKSSFIRERDMGREVEWKNIPIISYSRIPSRKGKMMSVSAPMRRGGMNVLPFEEDLESSTTEEETTTSEEETSTSEEETTEDEWTTTDEEEEEGRGTLKHGFTGFGGKMEEMKFFMKKYVEVLKKIFYPNHLVAKIVPMETRTMRRGLGGMKENLQLVLDVEMKTLRGGDINVHVKNIEGKYFLVIECEKNKKFPGCVIPLPPFFNVNKLMYHILPLGRGTVGGVVLRIELPIIPTMFMKKGNMAIGSGMGSPLTNFYYDYDVYWTKNAKKGPRGMPMMPQYYKYY